MPFRARYQGEVVTPAGVPDGDPVTCLDCGATLFQRGGPELADHFYHPPSVDVDDCIAQQRGESDTHARCVSLAVDALADTFDGQYEVCRPEVTLDVSQTTSPPDRRRADALLAFRSENPVFGQGIIIEVQNQHHTKNREATTHDYLAAGYSVAWLDTDEFATTQLDYDVVDPKFRESTAPGYTVRDDDAREFAASERESFDWDILSRGCWHYQDHGIHAWFRVPAYAHPQGREYEACRFCDARRRYDSELTRYVYDHEGVLAPEFTAEALRGAFVRMWSEDITFEDWVAGEARYSELTLFEEALFWGSGEPCRSELGLHVWGGPEPVGDKGALWACRHCPVHLLTKKEGERFIVFGGYPRSDWGLIYLEGNPHRCSHRLHSADWQPENDTCPDCKGPIDPDGYLYPNSR